MRFLNQAMAYKLTRQQMKQFRGAVAAGHLPWEQLCDQISVVNKIKIRRARATRLESMVQGLLAANQRLEKEVKILRELNPPAKEDDHAI